MYAFGDVLERTDPLQAVQVAGVIRHLVTGGWLMYLAYAVAVDFAVGYHWRV